MPSNRSSRNPSYNNIERHPTPIFQKSESYQSLPEAGEQVSCEGALFAVFLLSRAPISPPPPPPHDFPPRMYTQKMYVHTTSYITERMFQITPL